MKNNEIKANIYGGPSYGTSMSIEKFKDKNKKTQMTIKEIRQLTGLSQEAFARKYNIPFQTYRTWESDVKSSRHRECPEYVKELLEFKVRHDVESENKE